MMDLTLNFGQVALRNDPVFGVLVYADPGEWVPFSSGSPEEQDWVRQQVLAHPLQRCLTDGMRAVLFPDGLGG